MNLDIYVKIDELQIPDLIETNHLGKNVLQYKYFTLKKCASMLV